MPNPYGWGQNEPQIKPKDQGGDSIATFSQKIYNLFDNLFNTLNSYPWSPATQSDAGYMSAEDKAALDDVPNTYLPLSGGAMSGDIANAGKGFRRIFGGSSSTDGARLAVSHEDNPGYEGEFWLVARANGTEVGLIGKPNGTLTWDGYQLSPIAKSASGVGQWQRLFVNAASISLPAGGTWAYYVTGFSSGGSLISVQANVAAGGTTVISDAGVARCYGFCWRVA